jgi:hypothetical protein
MDASGVCDYANSQFGAIEAIAKLTDRWNFVSDARGTMINHSATSQSLLAAAISGHCAAEIAPMRSGGEIPSRRRGASMLVLPDPRD